MALCKGWCSGKVVNRFPNFVFPRRLDYKIQESFWSQTSRCNHDSYVHLLHPYPSTCDNTWRASRFALGSKLTLQMCTLHTYTYFLVSFSMASNVLLDTVTNVNPLSIICRHLSGTNLRGKLRRGNFLHLQQEWDNTTEKERIRALHLRFSLPGLYGCCRWLRTW